MSNRLLEKGREGLIDGTVDLDTNTIKVMLMNLDVADTAVKAITGATNATPIVVTATGHGFATGDVVVIGKVGGNLAANNLWKIVVVDANSFSLRDVKDGSTNSVGSAAYTSGGYAVCLGPSVAGDNLDDFDGCRASGSTDQTLTSPTVTNGTFDAADPTFTAVPGGADLEAALHYKDTGTGSTSRAIFFQDGRIIVECNTTAAAAATSIPVLPLPAGLASGTVLTFSNGATATLSGAAAAGARSISVTALAAQVTAGSYASADTSPASGFPVTPNGGNISLSWDNGVNRIFTV
jgi:hypothetical protein